MKGIDLFCASPASTAICSSLDQRSMVRHRMRPIHRHRPLGDQRKGQKPIPCSSQLPIDPKFNHQKSRKSSAKQSDPPRKSSSACMNNFTSPPGSSRYLLSDTTPFFDLLSDSDHATALVPSQNTRPRHLRSNDSPSLKSSSTYSRLRDQIVESDLLSDSEHVTAVVPGQNTRPRQLSSNESGSLKSSSTRSRPRDQVVELRVSIHCKGCEGKVRKHISRMEGVTSFNIDLATKKVTVVGDVTPLGVLSSISRVKNAQFWPSPTSSSSSSPSPMVGLSY